MKKQFFTYLSFALLGLTGCSDDEGPAGGDGGADETISGADSEDTGSSTDDDSSVEQGDTTVDDSTETGDGSGRSTIKQSTHASGRQQRIKKRRSTHRSGALFWDAKNSFLSRYSRRAQSLKPSAQYSSGRQPATNSLSSIGMGSPQLPSAKPSDTWLPAKR